MNMGSPIEFFNAELMAVTAALKTQVDELMAENGTLKNQLEEAKQEKSVLERDLNYHREKLKLLLRDLYGARSERRILENELSGQIPLPGFEDTNRPKPPPVTTEKIAYTRRKPAPEGTRGPRKSRFPQWLRRVQELIEPATCECPKCKGTLKGTGNFEITEKLCCSRDPFYVKEFHRELMVCPHCETAQTRPPVPEVFERSIFDHTAVAYFIYLKLCHGVPWVKQGKMLSELEIKVSSDSICRGSLLGLDLMMAIYKAICCSIFSGLIVVVDDTRLLAATGEKLKKLPKYKRGCLWGIFGDANEVMYHFSPARTHEACFGVLSGFSGKYIVCDGYSGFDSFVQKHPEITLVNCNNHARRKFIEAEVADKVRSDEAAAYYQHLYRIEEEANAKELSPDERKAYRIAHAQPILEQFKAWNEAVLKASHPKDTIHKAAAYFLTRWDSLTAYLNDGRLPFDSMQIERAFRSIAVGRKNWLHASSEMGAQLAAVGYTIVNSCILAGVDPFIYLCDIFERISDRNTTDPNTLIPRIWKERYYEEARKKYLEVSLK